MLFWFLRGTFRVGFNAGQLKDDLDGRTVNASGMLKFKSPAIRQFPVTQPFLRHYRMTHRTTGSATLVRGKSSSNRHSLRCRSAVLSAWLCLADARQVYDLP